MLCSSALNCNINQQKIFLISVQSQISFAESVSYEFSGRGGIITYTYPRDKQPDTKVKSKSIFQDALFYFF